MFSTDFSGPFGPNIKGSHYKYFLVIIDQLSRFPILVPCKTNNAQVVINAVLDRVCADYSLPESIILDRAGSLKGHQMRAHLESFGIQPEFVAPDNHRANGLAERVIREFNDRMNLTNTEHWKTWHKQIKNMKLSLRTNPNEDTGFRWLNSCLAGT